MRTLLFLLFLLITLNLNAQWIEIQSDSIDGIGNIHLESIFFLNSETGYVKGFQSSGAMRISTYFKTTDGGANWTHTIINGGEGDVCFINDTLGFVGGYPALKTIDGGMNWTAYQSAPPSGDIIQFVNDSIGYILSESELFRTNDAGTNWFQLINAPIIGSVHNMYFYNENIGYLLGAGYLVGGEIVKTIDGGISWTRQINGGGHPVYDAYFTDISTGYVVGGGATSVPHGQMWESEIFKTIDGGANWFLQHREYSEQLMSVVFTDTDTGYAVGGLSSTILKTVNGGTKWTIQKSLTSYLNSVFFINSNIGYIAGGDGVILKTTNGGGPLPDSVNNYIGKTRIYPNPASQKIFIEFENPNHFPFELSLFDNLGRKVIERTSIIKEIIEVEINTFSKGFYYYELIYNPKEIKYTGKFIKN